MKLTCILLYNSPTKFEKWIGEQKKRKRARVATLNKLSTWNQLTSYIWELDWRTKKREWLLLTNFPHEINMFFYTTHLLNLKIGLENRKKEERAVTLNKLSTWNQHVLLLNSPTKFENWIGEKWLQLTNCPHEINIYFYKTHLLSLGIESEQKKKRECMVTLFHMKSTCTL